MARSVWKGPFVDMNLLKKAEKVSESGRKEVIKTWSRRSTILPQFVGLTFGVYNGQKFVPVSVTNIWLDTNLENFHQQEILKGILLQIRKLVNKNEQDHIAIAKR